MAVDWIRASASGPEIAVFDDIGFWGTTADRFRKELASLGDGPLTVRINSKGGDPFDAVAIANMLWDRGNVTTIVESLAASAASVISQGGHTRIAAANSSFLIHGPRVQVTGSETDLEDAIRSLATVRSAMRRTYASRTKQPSSVVDEWMSRDTWFDGNSAKEAGLVDQVKETMIFSASIDLSSYASLPENLRSHSGRQQQLTEAKNATSHGMNVIGNFIKRLKGDPSEIVDHETKITALIKGLGFDDTDVSGLIESKDDQALRLFVEAAIKAEIKTQIEKATDEANGRLVKISDVLKSAGFDGNLEKIDEFKASVDARIEEAASRKALTITASRGIRPVATTAAATGVNKPMTLTERAIAARKAAGLPVGDN